jgi:hypothetical protein
VDSHRNIFNIKRLPCPLQCRSWWQKPRHTLLGVALENSRSGSTRDEALPCVGITPTKRCSLWSRTHPASPGRSCSLWSRTHPASPGRSCSLWSRTHPASPGRSCSLWSRTHPASPGFGSAVPLYGIVNTDSEQLKSYTNFCEVGQEI